MAAPAGRPPRARASRIGALAAAALIGLPAVLAFFSGGYYDEPRLVAAVAVWLAVAGVVVLSARPLPRTRPARVALLGLALLCAWVTASLAWAPLGARALDDSQRVLLYLGAAVLAVALLRPREVARWVEPGLAAGATAVIVYGLSGRLLPGLVEQETSGLALGRLDQPLTYWNAVAAVGALGLVLCARLAGDAGRSGATRALAAAAAPPLGAGLYLTLSRGGLLAAAVGLLTLALLSRTQAERVALALATTTAVGGALAVAFFPDVTDPVRASGEGEGALALGLLVLVASTAALAARVAQRRPAADERETRTVPPAAAAAIVLAVSAGALGAAALVGDDVPVDRGGRVGAERLRSLQSQRYDYWKVAGSAFLEHPLAGVVSGGFEVEWRRERPAGAGPAADAHSLYVETLAELGVVGVAFLALLIGGVVACGRTLWRSDPALAAGPIAALGALALHAAVDWDWEMPAVALCAAVLAGLLMAGADESVASPG